MRDQSMGWEGGHREREVFLEAVGISDAERRRAYLERVCREDEALRAAVEGLLKAHEDRGFMRTPALGRAAGEGGGAGEESSEQPGERVGRYRLVRVVGEGGCGMVWLAEQEEPVRRRVAVKILRPGMDSRLVIARFEAERQALAWMEHPGIARILDGGTTGKGRPFFVMEFIDGERVTRYCRRTEMGLVERLGLFVSVCEAVQHAHQKGWVHRDLKPSNVLVTEVDGRPVAKVIDFGIAKVLAGTGGSSEELTRQSPSSVLGTPAYMSPEQASGTGAGVDTRTDVYSLGVLLYELLTGTTPFESSRLSQASAAELERILREEAPVPPSRLPGAGKEVRGELDWVTLRCLEKEPGRRYGTVNELASDLRRYLGGRPVEARPPGGWYLFTKFVRRHRLAFGAATAVTLAVAGALAVSLWQVGEQRRLAAVAAKAEGEQRRLRGAAEEMARTFRRRAYLADMQMASAALKAQNPGWARRLLDEQVPGAGEVDLRGWEWGYLSDQCRSDDAYELGRLESGVAALAASTHGMVVAGSAQEGEVVVWEVAGRREVGRWSAGSDSQPVPVAVSSDGGRVASGMGGRDGVGIRLWDVAGRRVVRDIGVSGPLVCLGFAGSEGWLVALGVSGEWVRCRGSDGAEVGRGRWEGVEGMLRGVVGPGIDGVIVGFADGTLRAMDLANGRERWRTTVGRMRTGMGERRGAVKAVALSADGKVVSAGYGEVSLRVPIVSAADGVDLGPSFGLKGGSALAFSPDGRWLASAGGELTVSIGDLMAQPRVWAFLTGDVMGKGAVHMPTARWKGHTREVTALAWVGADGNLVSGDRGGTVLGWSHGDGRGSTVAPWPWFVPGDVKAWGWETAADGERLWTVSPSGAVHRREVGAQGADGELLCEVGMIPVAARFSRGARWLAVADKNGTVEIWEPGRRRTVGRRDSAGGAVELLGFVEDEPRVVLRDGASGGFEAWDFREGRDGLRWSAPVSPSAVALSVNGRWWASAEPGGVIRVRDLRTGRLTEATLDSSRVVQMAIDDAGERVALFSPSGEGGIWELGASRRVGRLEGTLSEASVVAFSPDGGRLVWGGASAEGLRVYETSTCREVLSVARVMHRNSRVAFSPSGIYLVTTWGMTSGGTGSGAAPIQVLRGSGSLGSGDGAARGGR